MVANNEKRLGLTRVINLHVKVDQREMVMWMRFPSQRRLDYLPNPKGKQGMRKIDRLVSRESWNSSNIYQETSRGLSSRWSQYWKVLLSGKVERVSLICVRSVPTAANETKAIL